MIFCSNLLLNRILKMSQCASNHLYSVRWLGYPSFLAHSKMTNACSLKYYLDHSKIDEGFLGMIYFKHNGKSLQFDFQMMISKIPFFKYETFFSQILRRRKSVLAVRLIHTSKICHYHLHHSSLYSFILFFVAIECLNFNYC